MIKNPEAERQLANWANFGNVSHSIFSGRLVNLMRDQFRDNAPQQIWSGIDLACFSESAQSPRLWQILILLRWDKWTKEFGVSTFGEFLSLCHVCEFFSSPLCVFTETLHGRH